MDEQCYDVILSIKPIYVEQIKLLTKKFEYRKQTFKRKVRLVYIYESYPTKKIVGYFKYHGYISETPKNIWEETKENSGISYNDYTKYFSSYPTAYALLLKEVSFFSLEISPTDYIKNFKAPQSYQYVEMGVLPT